MAPSWSFQQITSALPTFPAEKAFEATESSDQNSFLQTNPTRYSITYGRMHLLGLPSEVRDGIWQTIFDDITAGIHGADWDKRPSIAYSGLSLTCHQVHDEIAFFWPRTIIQHNRITTFNQPHVPNLRDFRRLTLEIPLGLPYGFFRAAGESLAFLAPILHDLRLFFIGSDKFRTPLRLNGCGLHESNIGLVSKKLPIDGQRHSERLPLFLALHRLHNLRSLVMSNHNWPVLSNFVLEFKPYLRSLHMVVDSRTTVHKNICGIPVRSFFLVTHDFPPVEVLSISANAALNTIQLAASCTWNLKHMTWTVPDLSLQSAGGLNVNWYRDTALLLHTLRRNSKHLQTLRMCFQEAIYEADSAAGSLVPAIQQHLQYLPIETLELHIDCRSPWFGREIIQCLPNSLRRLYVSRELLDEGYLTRDIDSRYMACHSSIPEGSTPSRFLQSLQGLTEDDIIPFGEEKQRRDFISLGGGKLGFIGYEYEPTTPTKYGNSELRKVEAQQSRTWLLTLNGRLLDRERNMHLVKHDGGCPIPPLHAASSSQKYSIAESYGPLWVYAPPTMKEREAAAKELADSVLAQYLGHYFGNEHGAVQIFDQEPGVHADDVGERLWPDEVSTHEGEHWLSDHEAVQRVKIEEIEEHDGLKSFNASDNTGWGDERLLHWVQNWTW